MARSNSIVVPVVMWGCRTPTHCISCTLMTPSMSHIVTGCNDGLLCVWDVLGDWQVCPRSLLFGHSAGISCLANGSSQSDKKHIISSAENGEMCLWDIGDGCCLEHTKMANVHTHIAAYHFRSSNNMRLLCNGHYPEVLVIDPLTFEVVHCLRSQVAPDWISACCLVNPSQRSGQDDVILAVSSSGAVKVWTLDANEYGKVKLEHESKQTRCLNAQTLTCCPVNQRTLLIVCSKYWQVYDASDLTLLCSESSRCGERWAGGSFVSVDHVVVWSNEGRGYLYKLPTNATPGCGEYHKDQHGTTVHAYYILDGGDSQDAPCYPAFTFIQHPVESSTSLLLRGDAHGRIVIWLLPSVSEKQITLVRQESFDRLPSLPPKVVSSLSGLWTGQRSLCPGILDGLEDGIGEQQNITATIFIPSQGKLVCGRENGSIVIVSAVQCIRKQLFTGKESEQEIPVQRLDGHAAKVTCLLYPFNESTRYDADHLLSGGEDFSVVLWDMKCLRRLCTFVVHGGVLEQLIVPPGNCSPRTLLSVCSVASDHSVALLNLRERKCIMFAGRHLFPVRRICWKPVGDFILVCCTDGSVYVWEIETGHLDRVVHGITANDIVHFCDDIAMQNETVFTQPLTFTQALKTLNLTTFRNLVQQTFLQQGSALQAGGEGEQSDFVKPKSYPLIIQGFRTNSLDSDAHILFFDTESLIIHLLYEEFSRMSPGELKTCGLTTDATGGSRSCSFLGNPAHPLSGILTQRRPDQLMLRPQMSSGSLAMNIAQLFTSVLHAWGLDCDLDHVCVHKLGLLTPRCPISFGLLSPQGHMSLMLPCSRMMATVLDVNRGTLVRVPCHVLGSQLSATPAADNGDRKVTLLARRTGSVPLDYTGVSIDGDDAAAAAKLPPVKGESQVCAPSVGSALTCKLANQPSPPMDRCLEHYRKMRWQASRSTTTHHLLSIISVANTLMSMSRSSFTQHSSRDAGSDAATSIHCAVVKEGSPTTPNNRVWVDMATMSQVKQGWSLLTAHHCILLPEMIGAPNYRSPFLEILAQRWQDRCMEIREAAQALLLAELRRIGTHGRKVLIDEWSPFLPMHVDKSVSIMNEDSSFCDDEYLQAVDEMLGGDLMTKTSVVAENRQKQATAVVMLAVIGAEFGQETEPGRRKAEDSKKSKALDKAQDGFNVSNYSLSRKTSRALKFMLLAPPNRRLPAHTPIRRAAIDLLGRGFTVWEPYLDISSVLMGLLDLSSDSEKRVPSFTFGLPLPPASDACRTARHALSLIAAARSDTFIITMAKEVARYNALAQNIQSQHTQIHNMVLVKAAPEIMHLLEMLVDKMPNNVANLIVEVMDIAMHCLDLGQLRIRGLQDLFPALCRFSMVSYCSQTKRIWVGTKNGGLAMYEMKPHAKCQMIQAHNGHVVAVAVSPDSKFVATLSYVDLRIKFFQAASSSIFSLSSQQTKCVRQYTIKEMTVSPSTNILKLVRLVWIDNRTLVLLTVDGEETKYSV